MAFWGVEVKKGAVAPFVPPPDAAKLHVSQACLAPDAPPGARATLLLKVGDGAPLAVARLREGGAEGAPLDLILDGYSEFSVDGGAAVHVTGYYMPEFEAGSSDGDDDDDGDGDGEHPGLARLRGALAAKYGAPGLLGFDDDGRPVFDGDYDSGDDSDYSSGDGDEMDPADFLLTDSEDGGGSGDDSEDDDSEDDGSEDGGSEDDSDLDGDSDGSGDGGDSDAEEGAKRRNGVVIEELPTANGGAAGAASGSGSESESDSEGESDGDATGSSDSELDGSESLGSDEEAEFAALTAAMKDAKKRKAAAAGAAPPQQPEKRAKPEPAAAAPAKAAAKAAAAPPAAKPAAKAAPAKAAPAKAAPAAKAAAAADPPSLTGKPKVLRFPNGFEIHELATGPPGAALARGGATIAVRYVGRLQKGGKVFDQTKGRSTFKFRLGVGEVIAGWDKGCEGMRVGDRRRLVVPPAMGYGGGGVKGAIPPNAWLEFDVELVDVGKKR